jgi:hypothetical protein
MATTLDEVWALFREVAESQKDTDRRMKETDRQMKETDRQIKQLGKQIGELGHRLGEFVEGLVKPAVVRLFQARGIDIHEVYPDVEVDRGTEGIQIDLLVVNDTEAVLVEVKSKLTVCRCRRPRGALGEIQTPVAALRRGASHGRDGRDGDPEGRRPLRLPQGLLRAGAER